MTTSEIPVYVLIKMQLELRSPALVSERRRFSDRSARTADVIVEILQAHGVEVVFCLPGGMISPVVDALHASPIKTIVAKHEANAVFMAIGHARVSGKVGVVVVTSGPGLTNTLTGVSSARLDSVPLLVLAGEVHRDAQGKGALQEGSAHHLNLVQAFRPVTKYAAEIPRSGAAAPMVLRALATATSGRHGPVLLTVPINVSSDRISVPMYSQSVRTTFDVDTDAIERAALELGRSQRKVIFAGSGVRFGRGAELLLTVAERLQCAVMTTPKGKGVFPEDHPLHIGVFGMGGHASTKAFLEQGVEVVLAIGTSLGDLQTNSWSPLLNPSRTFIHVDIEASSIGRAYRTHLAVTAPAEVFLERLLDNLPMGIRVRQSYGIERYFGAGAPRVGERGLICPAQAVLELQALLPEDTIFTVDSGEHYFFATHMLETTRSDAFIVMTGLGAMGSSVGAAIGAAIASPDRRACVICGDGGYAMMASELETAVEHGIPIIVVVLNDHALGMVKLGHQALFSRSPSFAIRNMDVVEMARAVGCHALRVTGPGDMEAADSLVRGGERPVVIDVQIDPTIVMPKNNRFETLADITGGRNGSRRRI